VPRSDAAAGLRFEALEPRRLCAGDVTSRLVGSVLLITGDRQDNLVVVSALKGGGIAVIGDGTTVNGAATPFVTHRPVTAVVTTLGRGDDVAAFTNNMFAIQLLYPGDVDAIQDVIGAATDGEFWFSLPGGITVSAGAGNDRVFLVGELDGSLAAHLGPSSSEAMGGGNSLTILSSGIPIAGVRRPSVVRGSIFVSGGTGNDYVDIHLATIGGSVTSKLGGGGNATWLRRCSVGGSVTVTGFAGPDGFTAESLDVAGGLVLALGRGANGVGCSFVQARRVVVTTGADDDGMWFVGLAVRDTVQVTLGGGDDALEFETVQARWAFLGGGLGANALTLNAATRSGVRSLRFVRFQTVTG